MYFSPSQVTQETIFPVGDMINSFACSDGVGIILAAFIAERVETTKENAVFLVSIVAIILDPFPRIGAARDYTFSISSLS